VDKDRVGNKENDLESKGVLAMATSYTEALFIRFSHPSQLNFNISRKRLKDKTPSVHCITHLKYPIHTEIKVSNILTTLSASFQILTLILSKVMLLFENRIAHAVHVKRALVIFDRDIIDNLLIRLCLLVD